MLDLSMILNAVKLAGSELPAFKSLFEHAVSTFGTHDQATLKAAYASEIARSDDAHNAVQDALK